MGVDAQMYVLVGDDLDDEAVRRIGYELGSCVGPNHFLTYEAGRFSFSPEAHGPVSRVSVYEQDGDDVPCPPGKTMLEVHFMGRYYGIGYERGDLWVYVATAEWFERTFAGAEVFYGGDSSGVLAEPFGPSERENLVKHWVRVGCRPYYSYQSFGDNDGIEMPECPVCHVPLSRFGWGAQYAAASCQGCGHRIETRDRGATWTLREREL